MEIGILLNSKVVNIGEVQAELNAELNALTRPGVSITSKTAPPPKGTLGLEEVVQFIITYREDILKAAPVLVGAIQIIMAVLHRRGIEPPKKIPSKKSGAPKRKSAEQKKSRESKNVQQEPVIVLVTGDYQLKLPCTTEQADDFIKKISSEPVAKVSVKSNKAKPNKR